jgi:hypothetical protein
MVTMKNAVFWDVTPCDSCKNRRFGGTYRLHLQGGALPYDITTDNARNFLLCIGIHACPCKVKPADVPAGALA